MLFILPPDGIPEFFVPRRDTLVCKSGCIIVIENDLDQHEKLDPWHWMRRVPLHACTGHKNIKKKDPYHKSLLQTPS